MPNCWNGSTERCGRLRPSTIPTASSMDSRFLRRKSNCALAAGPTSSETELTTVASDGALRGLWRSRYPQKRSRDLLWPPSQDSPIIVPQIVGQNGRLTLRRLIANGAKVQEGDLIAEFDPTQQLDAAFNARARFERPGPSGRAENVAKSGRFREAAQRSHSPKRICGRLAERYLGSCATQ
jgi:hypothetical protein